MKGRSVSTDVFSLTGSLTVQRVAEVREQLRSALKETDARAVDLSGVEEIDLAGLQLLCAANREAFSSGRSFDLAGPFSDDLGRFLNRVGISGRGECGGMCACACLWRPPEE